MSVRSDGTYLYQLAGVGPSYGNLESVQCAAGEVVLGFSAGKYPVIGGGDALNNIQILCGSECLGQMHCLLLCVVSGATVQPSRTNDCVTCLWWAGRAAANVLETHRGELRPDAPVLSPRPLRSFWRWRRPGTSRRPAGQLHHCVHPG